MTLDDAPNRPVDEEILKQVIAFDSLLHATSVEPSGAEGPRSGL